MEVYGKNPWAVSGSVVASAAVAWSQPSAVTDASGTVNLAFYPHGTTSDAAVLQTTQFTPQVDVGNSFVAASTAAAFTLLPGV